MGPVVGHAGSHLDGIREAVDRFLSGFLDGKARAAAAERFPQEVVETLRDFLFAGGKRIRPVLCVMGWRAAGGRGAVPGAVVQVAAALEMFHAFALIHDDVMDDSMVRRGRPTVHRALAVRHGQTPAHERLGVHAAILVGDMAMAWSDEILHAAGLTAAQLAAALPVVAAMRSEVMYGQYLDLLATGRPTADVERALAIVRYKTAKYTVERPLHLGAALAGAGGGVESALTTFALPAGEAFQLRDDLLGVFGDPARTGKSVLEDLSDAKHTVLMAIALQTGGPDDRYGIQSLLTSSASGPDRIAALRAALEAAGARSAVEHLITGRYDKALRALDNGLIDADAADALREITRSLCARTA